MERKDSQQFNEIKWEPFLCRVALFITFMLSWASFVFTPMTGDIKVFLASANQSSYISDNLIVGAFKAWELKGVLSRTFMYLIYKISCCFVSFPSCSFEICCKFAYSLIIISASFASMKLWFGHWERKVSFRLLAETMAVSAAFMTPHTSCHMQVEMTCSLLALLSFSLYVNAVETNQNLGLKLIFVGIMVGMLFYFKSVLILLSLVLLVAACIYHLENNTAILIKRITVVALGAVITLFAILVLILIINPSELQDMLDASVFQSTLFTTSDSILKILLKASRYHIKNIFFLPAVLIGIICFVVNLQWDMRRKNYKQILLHFIMWLMGFLFIALSNQYFPYHFTVYLFPSLFEIYCALNKHGYAKLSKLKFLKIGVLCLVAIYGLLSFRFAYACFKCNLESYQDTVELLAKIDYDHDAEMMYLDAGTGAYYLGNVSYLKHYFPLPLQRLNEESSLPSHVDSLTAAMNYHGKYISLHEGWFFQRDNYQSLKEKIESEYHYVGSYSSFSPPFSFCVSHVRMGKIALYVKN